MQKVILFFLVFILVLVSCKKMMDKPTCPVIAKNEFVDLLINIHLAEAMSSTVFFRDSFSTTKAVNLTDSVIRDLGYTKALFDSTVAYYAGYPKEYEIIYDLVITELNRKSVKIETDRLEKVKQSELK